MTASSLTSLTNAARPEPLGDDGCVEDRPRSPCVALDADELRGLAGGARPDERVEVRQRAPCGGCLSGPECPGDISVGELGEIRAAGKTSRTSNTVDPAQQRIVEGKEHLCHARKDMRVCVTNVSRRHPMFSTEPSRKVVLGTYTSASALCRFGELAED
jgi:hypothetical protein